jgi:hypothetical protein
VQAALVPGVALVLRRWAVARSITHRAAHMLPATVPPSRRRNGARRRWARTSVPLPLALAGCGPPYRPFGIPIRWVGVPSTPSFAPVDSLPCRNWLFYFPR